MNHPSANGKLKPAQELLDQYGIPIFKGRINKQRHGIGLLVDCETTGGSTTRNALVEAAFLSFVCEFHGDRQVEILGALDAYSGLNDPGEADINPFAMRINRLTLKELAGQALDRKRIQKIISRADHVVAHNVDFDRAFLTKAFPSLAELPWYCTFRNVPWKENGHDSCKLRLLCKSYGIRPPTHRAMEDVRATFELLSAPFSSTHTVYQTMLFGAGLNQWSTMEGCIS